MASSLSNIAAKDGAAATVAGGILAVDKSGAGTGPFFAAQTIVDTQGVNTATVKAASTAPAATDTSVVVAPNPNSLQMGAGATTAITQRVALASDTVNPNGQATMANSAPVVLANNHSNIPTKEIRSATGVQSIVAGSATSVTVLASNAARLGATVFNDSTAILYLLSVTGGTASTTVHTVQVAAGGYYEVPFNYTGDLKGLWASATGSARVTEFA